MEGTATALHVFWRNLKEVPRNLRESVVRHGAPTSDRARSQAVAGNFFLHMMSARIHKDVLRFSATLGLGLASLVLFLLLTATGILLMIYYKPAVDQAYDSMKDITFVVPTGRFMRNIHRWSAHAMVVCVILHMARVFYTSAYKKPREFNWMIGMGLFVLTLGLSFTGYLLPWDQLAFWAITIGANIAQSPQELTDTLGITGWFDPGGLQKELLLGAHYVGQEALIRFYVLHVMVLPLLATILIGLHMWRVRKDGGLARPPETVPPVPPVKERPTWSPPVPADTPSTKSWGLMALVRGKTAAVDRELVNTIPAYPHLLYAVAALTMVTIAAMMFLGLIADAPLSEEANPLVPENPAKAPWYFLGLQEMVGYSAFMGGMAIPMLVVVGLALIPYLDREEETPGRWLAGVGRRVARDSAIFSAAVTIGLLVFTVNLEWLREWFPGIPQIFIILINPGTVLLAALAYWSIRTVRASNSTRLGAVALFTSFLVAFVILTWFATVHRGPNWDFYWWPSLWPGH